MRKGIKSVIASEKQTYAVYLVCSWKICIRTILKSPSYTRAFSFPVLLCIPKQLGLLWCNYVRGEEIGETTKGFQTYSHGMEE